MCYYFTHSSLQWRSFTGYRFSTEVVWHVERKVNESLNSYRHITCVMNTAVEGRESSFVCPFTTTLLLRPSVTALWIPPKHNSCVSRYINDPEREPIWSHHTAKIVQLFAANHANFACGPNKSKWHLDPQFSIRKFISYLCVQLTVFSQLDHFVCVRGAKQFLDDTIGPRIIPHSHLRNHLCEWTCESLFLFFFFLQKVVLCRDVVTTCRTISWRHSLPQVWQRGVTVVTACKAVRRETDLVLVLYLQYGPGRPQFVHHLLRLLQQIISRHDPLKTGIKHALTPPTIHIGDYWTTQVNCGFPSKYSNIPVVANSASNLLGRFWSLCHKDADLRHCVLRTQDLTLRFSSLGATRSWLSDGVASWLASCRRSIARSRSNAVA